MNFPLESLIPDALEPLIPDISLDAVWWRLSSYLGGVSLVPFRPSTDQMRPTCLEDNLFSTRKMFISPQTPSQRHPEWSDHTSGHPLAHPNWFITVTSAAWRKAESPVFSTVPGALWWVSLLLHLTGWNSLPQPHPAVWATTELTRNVLTKKKKRKENRYWVGRYQGLIH